MIRVVICDDQEVVREGLRVILAKAPDISVVGLARDGAAALELAASSNPDVILMDLRMPGINGIQATRQLRERFPFVRVLVLTTYDGDEWVFDAIRSGAAGYLLKDTPPERLMEAVRAVSAGQAPVDPAVAGRLFAHIARHTVSPDPKILVDLSERERAVLRLIAQALSNADIAQQLHLSAGTVRNYVSTILSKLGVSDRTGAAVWALRAGLLNSQED